MDIEQVRAIKEKIINDAGDDEAQHKMEDRLYADILAAIRDGACDDPIEVCREALTTKDIGFSRWCA